MPKRLRRVMGGWRDQAACVRCSYPHGDVNFYPEKSRTQAQEAKQVCAECPVKGECLDESLRNKERFGIWGGFDYTERKEIARQRGLSLAPSDEG